MNKPDHLPDRTYFESLDISEDKPLRILFSACLAGVQCGVDGTSYGVYPYMQEIIEHPMVKAVPFCPEDFSFGTPRELCDIHGGDGFDVLDGKAKVITTGGEDWTEKMIIAANWMLGIAKENKVQFAIMMDISAACGSQVIYDGDRTKPDKKYQVGMGVCAASLWRNDIQIVSQRDYKTLSYLRERLGIPAKEGVSELDHHEREWYREYFSKEISS